MLSFRVCLIDEDFLYDMDVECNVFMCICLFVTVGLCWTAEEDDGEIKGSGSNMEREGFNHFRNLDVLN